MSQGVIQDNPTLVRSMKLLRFLPFRLCPQGPALYHEGRQQRQFVQSNALTQYVGKQSRHVLGVVSSRITVGRLFFCY
jgi:hypothetical protein